MSSVQTLWTLGRNTGIKKEQEQVEEEEVLTKICHFFTSSCTHVLHSSSTTINNNQAKPKKLAATLGIIYLYMHNTKLQWETIQQYNIS